MRRTLTIALGSAVALITAAVAFAVVPSAVGISETTATFTASTAVNVKTRTCATDPYSVTDGRYKGGTITFADAALHLDGPLTFHARTTLNTATGLGFVEGSLSVKDDDSRFSGRFSGTLKGGNFVGFLTGTSRGNHAKVLGNISAPFAPATGFGAGALGSASSGSVLAVIAGPLCKKHEGHKSDGHKGANRASVEGSLTTLTLATATDPGTVTVTSNKGPTTCAIPKGSTLGTGLATNSKVELKCESVGDPAVLTATKLELHS